MKFVVTLYEEQVDGGRYFLHEHPLYADSRELECVRKLSNTPEVQRVHGDQCQFGAQIRSGQFKGSPTKKPTGFLTNSPKLAEVLARRCSGTGGECSRNLGGRHRHLTGRHAAEAAKYPKELCRAVIQGISQQLRADNLLKDGCFGVQVPDDEAAIEQMIRGPKQ